MLTGPHRHFWLWPIALDAGRCSIDRNDDLVRPGPGPIDESDDGGSKAMRYRGGKNGAGVYQTIINQIPPHHTYLEPFLGSGAILRHKKPALVSYGVDKDGAALDAVRGELAGRALVNLVEGCGIEFLEKWRVWKADDFVYCDPPYLKSTRSFQGDIYKYEMTAKDHARLIKVLLSLPCPVAISGYSSKLYEISFGRWRRIQFETVKHSGEKAIECVWMNYPEPIALHDYRYLGENFRERQRIKRKVERHRKRLAALPILERRLILMALQGIDEDPRS